MRFSVHNGTFAYPRSQPILQNVSFNVDPARLLAILGPNGVGKTTLLRCMMGMERWSSGASLLDGVNIRSLTPAQMWRRIAYVPQARSTGALSLTGLDMVIMGRSPHLALLAQPGPVDYAIAERVMTEIGISALADMPCGHMSGGQLQMILIARALATEPSLLILDEPETGLDFRNQLIVLDLLDSLVRSRGLSVVMNTHYPSHALRLADDALLLGRGCQAIHGPTDEVITAETMERVFDVCVHLSHVVVSGREYRDVLPLSIPEPADSRAIHSPALSIEEAADPPDHQHPAAPAASRPTPVTHHER